MNGSSGLARLFWRGLPVVLIVWAVRSGAIDYRKYVKLLTGETKTPVEVQLEGVANVLVDRYKIDRTIPEGYQLGFFLSQNAAAKRIAEQPDVDPFGNSLRIARFADGFTLYSDGPDRQADTEDDVEYSVDELEKKALELE